MLDWCKVLFKIMLGKRCRRICFGL